MNKLSRQTFSLKVGQAVISEGARGNLDFWMESFQEQLNRQANLILGKGNWYATKFYLQEKNDYEPIIIKMEVQHE